MSDGGAQFPINIVGTVPNILKYEDGKLFCNDGYGFQVKNADTGEVLYDSDTTADYVAWEPPAGVTNLALTLKGPSQGGA